jgi:hypothetical protein
MLFGAMGSLAQENQPDGPAAVPGEASQPSANSGEGLQVMELPADAAGSFGDGLVISDPFAKALQPDYGPDMPEEPFLSFSYYRLLGTAFNPRASATTFAYNSNGCIYETGGTDNRFMAPLLLPNGSVIKFLRFYYIDNNASTNLTAWLTRYQPGSTSEDLTSVNSTGASTVVGSSLSPEITHTVDLASWAYTIIIAPNGNASTNTLCGVRVAYYAPTFGAVALPMIIK